MNIQKIKGLWKKLIHQEATPTQIAKGFSIGLFISFLPIPPFQTATAIFFTSLLRVSRVAGVIGVHIHLVLFPLIPFIFFAEYWIGSLLFGLNPMEFQMEKIQLMQLIQKGWIIFSAIFLGSVILAIPFSLIGYWIVYRAARRVSQREKIPGFSISDS